MEIMGFNIKTRARWKAKSTSGHWCFGGLGQDKYGNYGAMWELVEGFGQSFICIDSKTICMSTGVKDSNNELIYENDYLKIVRADDKSVINAKAKVEYDNLQWFCSLDNGERYPLSRITNSVFAGLTYEFYVVGNRFDEE